MTSDVPVLGLSGLFVMVSIKVFPAWCNKHRANEAATRVFSVLALVATVAATVWLTWEVASLGVQHSPTQTHPSLYGTVFGIPIVLVPLAVLLAIVGVTELRGAERIAMPSLRLGKRRDADMLDSIRGQISGASSDTRTVLAEAISQIESSVSARIEERARLQAETGTAVETLQSAVAESASEVSDTFERVASLCASVTARLDAQRLEPDPLAAVIARLAAAPGAPLPVPSAGIDDIEINLVDLEDDDDELADEEVPQLVTTPAAAAVPEMSPTPPRAPAQPASAPLTTVERLRQRAQRVGREVWTRSKAQPSRSGRRHRD